MRTAVACAVAMAVTVLARSSLDTIGLLPVRLGAGLAVLGAAYVPMLLFVDRRSVDEIRTLLRAKWPNPSARAS